ncbi:MAG: aminotransferase class V-fold PLP-dependent enzyme [Geminicoccaceae bacterium]|nr:aminotransferase class V-fold PLP-dependent enzyme [Geminicoccaceae bacterium]
MPGRKGLFIPGPTNVPDEILRAIDVPMEDMRAPDFPEFTLPLFEDVKKVFKSETGQVFIFPASGTGGWEAGITNTLSPGDKVLAASFGQFSHLWIDLCQRHGLEVEVCDVPWGEGVPLDRYAEILKADRAHEIKAVLVTQNETATGVTSDVAGVRKALDDAGHPALLMVDGVSSIASIDFRMDEWGVDIAVSGSQKGFMMPTGLAIVCVSQKALEARKSAKLYRTYFSFDDMMNMNKNGYFPYTPATNMLRGLRKSVDMIFAEGLDNIFARHHHIAEGVRRGVHAWGLKLCAVEPKWYSDTVSAIVVPANVDGAEVVKRAYHRYDLSLGAGLARVAGKVFRIGHLGSLNEIMALSALAGAEMALVDCGADIKLGSGVGAAQAYYRERDRAERRAAA